MLNDDRMSRREALAILGGVAVAGVAGCVGGDGGSGSDTQDNTGDNQNTTGGPTDSGTNPDTNTRQNNTDGDSGERQENNDETGLSRLLEEDERRVERAEEVEITEMDGEQFVEFHNPKGQIPEENIDVEKYPSLAPLEEIANVSSEDLAGKFEGATAPYESGEDVFAHYMTWRENDNGNTQMSFTLIIDNPAEDSRSVGDLKVSYTDPVETEQGDFVDADIEHIL